MTSHQLAWAAFAVMFLCHIGIGYGLQARHGFVIDPYGGLQTHGTAGSRMHRLQHLGITFIRRKAWFLVDQTLLLFELSARDKRQNYTPPIDRVEFDCLAITLKVERQVRTG